MPRIIRTKVGAHKIMEGKLISTVSICYLTNIFGTQVELDLFVLKGAKKQGGNRALRAFGNLVPAGTLL